MAPSKVQIYNGVLEVSDMHFLATVLGQPRVQRIDLAVIFNICHVPNETLYLVEARAFVRHAFRCFYEDFSKVDTLGHAFTPVSHVHLQAHNGEL